MQDGGAAALAAPTAGPLCWGSAPLPTMSDIDRLLADLDQRMRGLRAPMTSDVHEVRRALSHQLRGAEPHAVLTLATALVARDGDALRS